MSKAMYHCPFSLPQEEETYYCKPMTIIHQPPRYRVITLQHAPSSWHHSSSFRFIDFLITQYLRYLLLSWVLHRPVIVRSADCYDTVRSKQITRKHFYSLDLAFQATNGLICECREMLSPDKLMVSKLKFDRSAASRHSSLPDFYVMF